MPEFTYTEKDSRYFHDFGWVEKGQDVTAKDNPDQLRFEEKKKTKSKPDES